MQGQDLDSMICVDPFHFRIFYDSGNEEKERRVLGAIGVCKSCPRVVFLEQFDVWVLKN